MGRVKKKRAGIRQGSSPMGINARLADGRTGRMTELTALDVVTPCGVAFHLPALDMSLVFRLGAGRGTLVMDVHTLAGFRAGWQLLERIAWPSLSASGVSFIDVEAWVIASLAHAARKTPPKS